MKDNKNKNKKKVPFADLSVLIYDDINKLINIFINEPYDKHVNVSSNNMTNRKKKKKKRKKKNIQD